MKLYPGTLASLLACAGLGLGLASCSGSDGRDNSGTAGSGMVGDAGTTGSAGIVGSAGTTGSAGRGGTTGTAGTGGTAPAAGGLFRTLLGKSQTEIDSKVTTAVNRFFGIGTNEPTTPTAAT